MKKKTIIIVLIFLIIISAIFFMLYNLKSTGSEDISPLPVDYNESEENNINEDKQKIDEIAENLGFTAEDDIYEIATEYDGRETVKIKYSIQYKVALAGSIKRSKPEFSEIDEIITNAPKHTGIWILKDSQEEFLNILNNICKAKYNINEEGYLLQEKVAFMNKYDKKIEQMLSDSKLYVFDINSISYLVDEVTGEIRGISI